MNKELYDKGLAVRREVLGGEHVDNAIKTADAFNQPLQELVTEYCWGAAWGSDGLSHKVRSMLNIAMISILNRPHELKLHVKGALNNGVTVDEIKAALLHATAYCGIPAGLDAFRAAHEVLVSEGVLGAK